MDCEDAHNGRGLSGAHCSNPARDIIGAEDEFFENDLNQTADDESIYFNSIEILKSRPTHLLVFLHHVILQFDCAPLLCYLHADLFRNLSTKETKKYFVDFYNNFLDKGAILRVAVPTNIATELDRTRPELISEEMQKRFAQEMQNMQILDILPQLEDFRQKRMMGMTQNEPELIEVEKHYETDRVPIEMKEKAVAERLLEKLTDSNPVIVPDEEKSSAIFGAVGFYMKHLGVKSKLQDSKKGKGFFRRKVPRKEDKSKVLSILRIGSSNEVKGRVDNEANKDSGNERKLALSRTLNLDGNAGGASVRKPSVQGTETNEAPNCSTNAMPTTDTTQAETGQTSSRSDLQTLPDGREVSPACPSVGISVCEPPSPSDNPAEEYHENDRRKTRSVRRSESLCVDRCHSRRGSSRAKQSRSRSDVDLQAVSISQPPSPFPQHISLEDGPLLPADGSSLGSTSSTLTQQEEMEPRVQELEQDPPSWKELAPSEVLKKLTKKEIKRQDVINELFTTEHAHVRMLTVLQTVFSRPLEREGIMDINELNSIFPNLDEITDMHYAFYENLKKLRQDDEFVVKNVSTLLLSRFNGSEGEWFQKLTARFCSHQSYTLVHIKNKQKKDPRFVSFIMEAESNPKCRRFQLKDIIPIEMQRLTKYPLLLENIAKNTVDNEEKKKIEQAAECCRKILNHVNDEVKRMENLLNLKDYQRRLDTSGLKPSNELYTEYKNLDMSRKVMIYEGPLTWRVTKEKALDVQGVLLGDMLVLLQKQDDKMLLKCQSKSNIAAQDGKQMLSPIIKLDSVFLREVATDRKAFYVIFTWDSGAQIYELVAQSVAEMRTWTDSIRSAVEELKKNESHTLDRKRLGSMPGGSNSLPYGSSLNPPLSPTDNGADVLKNSAGQYKDRFTDDKCSLTDYLAARGIDLPDHFNTPPERSAPLALDEVMSLKTLLFGSTYISKKGRYWETEAESEKQDNDGSLSQVEHHSVDSSCDEKAKDEEQRAAFAPVLLSQEMRDEVIQKLEGLEDHLKRLQSVEEEHHRLLEILADKFTIQRDYGN